MNMTLSIIGLAIIVCILGLFAVGCTSNAPFRTNFTECDPASADCANPVIEVSTNYKLGFVEFDDQGWFWNTNQAITVEKMIRDEGASSPPGASQGLVIIVFVHGWKNNAATNNDNVVMFRKVLDQFGVAESVQTNHPGRRVVGVYAGWRGLSATLEPFKEMSFWNRKATAHKVGGYGALTELLVELESIQQELNKSPGDGATPSELIIVGHSFGGAAVYSAIGQIVTERFVDTVNNNIALKPLGNQVILLNPAFEASRHFNLNQLAVSIKKYPANQRPVLSIFTSKGDWATHYAFPIGRFFSTIFEKNRDANQSRAGREAVGWFEPFVTHDLIYDTNAAAMGGGISTFNPATRKHELHGAEKLRASISHVREQKEKWRPNNPDAQTYYFDDTILKPRPGFRPGDPFPVVSVDKRIMKDHDDINNPVLINFLGNYVVFCRSQP